MTSFDVQEIRIAPCERMSDFRAMEDLQQAVWRGELRDVVPSHMLLAIAHNGGTVFGAWDEDKLIGMAVSIVAWGTGGPYHYSHLLGVLPSHRNSNVGLRLKKAQRDYVLSQGMRVITWTFDPLESTNAFLNFSKLGTISRTYKPDYYGVLTEQINQGLPSDRLIVEWHLDAARVRSVCRSDDPFVPPLCGTEEFLTRMDINGLPRTSALTGDAASWLIEIPADIQHLKSTDAAAALSWRMAVREAFTAAFEKGYTAAGYRPPRCHRPESGCYILSRNRELKSGQ